MVNQVVFSPDGRLLATASSDGTARVLDVETGRQVTFFAGHGDFWYHTRFILLPFHLVNCLLRPPFGLMPIRMYSDGIRTVVFTQDSRFVLTGGDDNMLRMWHARNGWPVKKIGSYAGKVGVAGSIGLSPDGQLIASTSGSSRIGTWSLETGELLWDREAHLPCVREVLFSDDGEWIISCGNDKANHIKIWEAETGEKVNAFTDDRVAISASLSRDGRRLQALVDFSEIQRIDVETGQVVTMFQPELEGHRNIHHVGWLPNDQHVLLSLGWGGEKGMILVDPMRPRTVQVFAVPQVTSVAVSPDGCLAATGGWDHTVRLWRLPDLSDNAPAKEDRN